MSAAGSNELEELLMVGEHVNGYNAKNVRLIVKCTKNYDFRPDVANIVNGPVNGRQTMLLFLSRSLEEGCRTTAVALSSSPSNLVTIICVNITVYV